MLQAILKGKIRGLFDKVRDGVYWREAYSSYEDFLTAAVVARLTYLPGDILWRLLRAASPHSRLAENVGGLLDSEFWPNWVFLEASGKNRKHRQPDVFLSFEKVVVIVEAKRDDSPSQDFNQWADQVLSYCHKRNVEGNERHPIVMWALGGMGEQVTETTMKAELGQLENMVAGVYPGEAIKLAVTPWKSLLSILIEFQQILSEEQAKYNGLLSPFEKGHILRIVNDMIESLRLHGIRDWHFLNEVVTYWNHKALSKKSYDVFKQKTDNLIEEGPISAND